MVVADRCRRIQRRVHIARLHNAALLRRMPPHTRVAVRLQLRVDGQMVLLLRLLLRQPPNLLLRARPRFCTW